jgi:hypothetical protein
MLDSSIRRGHKPLPRKVLTNNMRVSKQNKLLVDVGELLWGVRVFFNLPVLSYGLIVRKSQGLTLADGCAFNNDRCSHVSRVCQLRGRHGVDFESRTDP